MKYFESLEPVKTAWGYRLGMLLLIALALGVDLFLFQNPPHPTSLIAATVLSISSILFLFWPRLGGWIYLLADAGFVAFPGSFVGMLGYMCMAVVFLWGWRRYYLDAAIGIALLSVSFFLGAPKYPATGILTSILLLAGFTAGYMLRRYVDERDAALNQLWEEKLKTVQETQAFRDGLSVQLHDSVAGTLSIVASTAEVISGEIPTDSLARPKTELLRLETRRALSELREIIQLLDTRQDRETIRPNLEKELERAASVTAGAGLSLELDSSEEELKELPDYLQDQLIPILRETTTNAIKYASPSAPVTLSISQSENLVEFMMKNRVSEEVQDAVMSSGKGLLQLRKRLEDSGGSLEAWSANGWWIVHAELPIEGEGLDDEQ
ncbi:MAG: histidine kinase [Mobiluncus sp.]|uniref:Signal transduction histidine kinase subgroup 3 dimerisation and phosphoacceptor domain-containing protein n=1 Tax=Mobiluncus porci TaxID=2652278 RepID=A0A7K0K5D6_9ACTO|nr:MULTISPECIES: histidine kinase [Mobiluncus]MCI6585112.1 histidine kinase [Mobiluncus sp.]MST50646.1 hypothetical protein [Mobiluncus porci]